MTINSIFNQGFTNPFTKIKQSTQNILDTSTNIADDDLNTLTRTHTGTSESIEIDLSKSVNLEDLQSIVVYTSNDTYDLSFNKIKLETLNNVALDISEIQIWVDNSNIAPNSTLSYSSLYSIGYFTDLPTLPGPWDSSVQTTYGINDTPSNTMIANVDNLTWTVSIAENVSHHKKSTSSLPYLFEIDRDLDTQGYSSDMTAISSRALTNDLSSNDPNYASYTTTTRYLRIQVSKKLRVNKIRLRQRTNRSNRMVKHIRFIALVEKSGGGMEYKDYGQKYFSTDATHIVSFNSDNSYIESDDFIFLMEGNHGDVYLTIDNLHFYGDTTNPIHVIPSSVDYVNMLNSSITGMSSMTNTAIGEYFQFEIPYTNYRNLEAVVIYDSSNGELNNRKLTLLNNTVAIQEISFDNSTNSQNTFTKVTKIKGGSYNPKVKKLKKIRFETTKNYNLALSELQIWSNNNNVTQNNSTITTSELVTANSIIDQSLNTIYRTNTGTGKYIDLTLTNQVDVSDIQGIVAYTEIDSSRNPIINKLSLLNKLSFDLRFKLTKFYFH